MTSIAFLLPVLCCLYVCVVYTAVYSSCVSFILFGNSVWVLLDLTRLEKSRKKVLEKSNGDADGGQRDRTGTAAGRG